jgi:integrase
MRTELERKRIRRGGKLVPLTDHQKHKVWMATKAALAYAVRKRRISHNPIEDCDPPAKTDTFTEDDALVWWEPEVVAEFVAFARPDESHDDVEFMLRTGACLNFHLALRPGELGGLQWSDRDGGIIKIRRSRSMIGGRAEVELKAPKTKQGRREVVLSPTAASLWTALRERQVVVGMDGFVFAIDGEVVHPQRIIDRFQDLQREFLATRPHLRRLRFYDTRHCGITRWIKAGVDIAQVSRMAGHRSVAFSIDRYREVLPSDLAETAAKLAAID